MTASIEMKEGMRTVGLSKGLIVEIQKQSYKVSIYDSVERHPIQPNQKANLIPGSRILRMRDSPLTNLDLMS